MTPTPDPSEAGSPSTGTQTTAGTSPPTNCTDAHPHLCVDTWTPRSQLRRRSGELVAKENGVICSQESGGRSQTPCLRTVFISGVDGKRRVIELQWLANDPGTGEIGERVAFFDHIYLPGSVASVFRCLNWRSWLLFKLEQSGQSDHPIKDGSVREIFCHLACGLDGNARALLEEFAEIEAVAAFQSGWCESEADEARYDQTLAGLHADIQRFSFKESPSPSSHTTGTDES